MVYTVSVFAHLLKSYSNWSSLRAFLESEAGGSLRIIQEEGNHLAILRYVKGQSDLGNPLKPWVPWMRSVVWNTQTNLPICVAPRKAMLGDPSPASYDVQEFVEGVMVNGYCTQSPDMNWATRSSLGAKTGFYSTKSFAEMAEEAEPLRSYWGKGELVGRLKIHGYSFASFVLQHPEHRVVQTIVKPILNLIHLGRIDPDGTVVISDTSDQWPQVFQGWAVKSYEPLSSTDSPVRRMEQLSQTADSTWQGLVFRGSNGERWRLRSLSYKILRELRGKESRVEERFCRLRQQSMVRFYCTTWPEESATFFELEKRFRALTVKIYTEYCAVHKEKSKVFLDVAIPLRTPVYTLHGIYLNNLRPNNMTLKMSSVIQYMNNLPVEQQSALLRSNVDVDLTSV